jgi:hypothetical protein
MTTRTSRFFALAALALTALARPANPDAGEAAGGASEKLDIALTLNVTDNTNGLSLEANKFVSKDTNAFDALRHTVAVAYRTDAEGTPVVTSLCGVTPQKAQAWRCYVGGERCKPVGRVTLASDITIERKAE